ncbi:MAG: WxL domain-containing protein [Actinomycetota bacterium]|nr:WxL domain-containing protein [Actinomycetota bacterium]
MDIMLALRAATENVPGSGRFGPVEEGTPIIKRVGIVAMSAGILLFGVRAAQAQSLGITAATVSDFTPVSLSGSVATTTASMSDFAVTDSRGTGEGWNVVAQATLFAEWNGTAYVPGGKALPAGSLSMPPPTVSPIDAGTPSITPGPYAIDGSSVKIATAAPGTGEGTYTFSPSGPLTLTVVAGAYARTYRSEVTFSVTSGP